MEGGIEMDWMRTGAIFEGIILTSGRIAKAGTAIYACTTQKFESWAEGERPVFPGMEMEAATLDSDAETPNGTRNGKRADGTIFRFVAVLPRASFDTIWLQVSRDDETDFLYPHINVDGGPRLSLQRPVMYIM